jgi:hypothetical protein
MAAEAGDSPYTVTVDETNVEVSFERDLPDILLEVTQPLSGSALRTVRDHALTGTPLQLSEDAVKVDGEAIVDQISFDKAAAVSVAEGEMAWNDTDKCIDVGSDGTTLQVGQEDPTRIYNNNGVQIDNGEVVSIESDATSGRIHGVLADATSRSNARATIGLATQDIAVGSEGNVTQRGLVRGVDTSAYSVGDPLFLHASTPGAMQTTPPPSPPTSVVFIGVVVVAAEDGTIWVNVSIPSTLTELVDVDVSGPATNELLVYNATTSTFENKTPSLTQKLTLSNYVDKPARGKQLAQFGGIEKILDAGSFSAGTPDAATNGCGKLLFVINAGADLVGDFTVTGDTVDRNTGAITVGDTEVVTLDGASTDTSDTDAKGNVRYAFSGAYVTTKWFQGAISISTTEVDVSDFDIWNVAFHQFGDTPTSVELDTFDVTGLPTNTAAWLYAYVYSLEVTNGTCEVVRQGTIEIPDSAIDAADVHYRRKIGGIGKTLDPSTDGIWVDIFPGPFNQTYWGDIDTIVIYAATSPLTLS